MNRRVVVWFGPARKPLYTTSNRTDAQVLAWVRKRFPGAVAARVGGKEAVTHMLGENAVRV